MNRNARNRFVAWLGIAAMWLAIVAPVISQSLAAHAMNGAPHADMCAVESSPLPLPSQAGHHEASSHSHFDACDYCGLLAHELPIAPSVPPSVARIERVTRVATVAVVPKPVVKSFNAAPPRAPPFIA
jgi:hypothetical protein